MSEDEARVERVARAIESASDYVISQHYSKKVARAAIAAATAWLPIETAPRDRNIQAWHVSWECPITVRYLHDGISDCCWIEKTMTTRWPDRAFSHWMLLPEPPR